MEAKHICTTWLLNIVEVTGRVPAAISVYRSVNALIFQMHKVGPDVEAATYNYFKPKRPEREMMAVRLQEVFKMRDDEAMAFIDFYLDNPDKELFL